MEWRNHPGTGEAGRMGELRYACSRMVSIAFVERQHRSKPLSRACTNLALYINELALTTAFRIWSDSANVCSKRTIHPTPTLDPSPTLSSTFPLFPLSSSPRPRRTSSPTSRARRASPCSTSKPLATGGSASTACSAFGSWPLCSTRSTRSGGTSRWTGDCGYATSTRGSARAGILVGVIAPT